METVQLPSSPERSHVPASPPLLLPLEEEELAALLELDVEELELDELELDVEELELDVEELELDVEELELDVEELELEDELALEDEELAALLELDVEELELDVEELEEEEPVDVAAAPDPAPPVPVVDAELPEVALAPPVPAPPPLEAVAMPPAPPAPVAPPLPEELAPPVMLLALPAHACAASARRAVAVKERSAPRAERPRTRRGSGEWFPGSMHAS